MPVRVYTDGPDGETLALCLRLNQKNQTRSYPLHASQAALEDALRRCAKRTGGFLAGYTQDGLLKGVLFGFAEPDNHYLQTTGFYAEDASTASALSDWLEKTYAGYTANIGLPADNITAADMLRQRGYTMIDDALDLRLHRADFTGETEEAYSVQKITSALLPRYLQFHHAHFADCYWNAQRLEAHFADWHVYAIIQSGAVIGGLFMRAYAAGAAEIYGLHAATQSEMTTLLSRAIGNLFVHHKRMNRILFMADAIDPHAHSAALALGFRRENHYRCYEKTL